MKMWLQSMPLQAELTGRVIDPMDNKVFEHACTSKILLRRYCPLRKLYVVDFGTCEFPPLADRMEWQLPTAHLINGLLRNQPEAWAFRFGHRGTGSGIHVDEWGACFSAITVFSGCKRIIIFKKNVSHEYHNRMFGVHLTMRDKAFIEKVGGADTFEIRAGETFVFQAMKAHQVTNIKDNTLATIAILLTHDTLDRVIEDACRIPIVPEDRNLVWLGSVIHALHQELELHVHEQHLEESQVEAIVLTIRNTLAHANAARQIGPEHIKLAFPPYRPQKLKLLLRTDPFKDIWLNK